MEFINNISKTLRDDLSEFAFDNEQGIILY